MKEYRKIIVIVLLCFLILNSIHFASDDIQKKAYSDTRIEYRTEWLKEHSFSGSFSITQAEEYLIIKPTFSAVTSDTNTTDENSYSVEDLLSQGSLNTSGYWSSSIQIGCNGKTLSYSTDMVKNGAIYLPLETAKSYLKEGESTLELYYYHRVPHKGGMAIVASQVVWGNTTYKIQENPEILEDEPTVEDTPVDPIVEDVKVIAIEDIPIYEPPSEKFLPITNLEEEYKGAKEVAVQRTEEFLVDIYNDKSDVEIEEDLNGRLKIYKSAPSDDLSYETKKQMMKGTNFLLEKVADDTPLSHFVALSNNLIKDEIYDREDKIREIEEKLGLNFHEARGLEDFGNYDEKQKFLSPIKEYITSQDGVTGYTVGLVQKQLDKLADSKKKALGKAAAREYRNFAETYVENRKNKSHEEAIKAAHNRLEAMSYDAGAKDGGEENITFKTSSSNFFKEPIKFLSYKLLNRDSKKKTLQSRSAMYIGYLKEDKIYKATEGGN